MTMTAFKQSRRDFLISSAAAGGGLAIGMYVPSALAQKTGAQPGSEVDIWVVVNPDDTVVIRYARSEMGQGSMTSAAQLVAEELDCDWNKVRVEYADTNEHIRRKRAWGNMASVGSQTIRTSRTICAKAVRPRARCSSPQPLRNGKCRPPSAQFQRGSSATRAAGSARPSARWPPRRPRCSRRPT